MNKAVWIEMYELSGDFFAFDTDLSEQVEQAKLDAGQPMVIYTTVERWEKARLAMNEMDVQP
jgi:hypothetical protein